MGGVGVVCVGYAPAKLASEKESELSPYHHYTKRVKTSNLPLAKEREAKGEISEKKIGREKGCETHTRNKKSVIAVEIRQRGTSHRRREDGGKRAI